MQKEKFSDYFINHKPQFLFALLNQITLPLIFVKFYINRGYFHLPKHGVSFKYWTVCALFMATFFSISGLVFLGGHGFLDLLKDTKNSLSELELLPQNYRTKYI